MDIQSRKPLLDADLQTIAESAKEFIAVAVFDSGTQIDQSIQPKIFAPFYSTKGNFGLGLAIVKTAVTRMAGQIEDPIGRQDGKSIRVLIPKKEA